MTLCTGCYEIQEYGKQLEDEAGEENLNEMYEQDADDELECRHDEGNVSDAMAVHIEDEEHVDDESTYPTTEKVWLSNTIAIHLSYAENVEEKLLTE